jgi:hypothetical protein
VSNTRARSEQSNQEVRHKLLLTILQVLDAKCLL